MSNGSGNGEKLDEVNVFDQIDEALEEREGADRRKREEEPPVLDEDRRKNDRRAEAKAV